MPKVDPYEHRETASHAVARDGVEYFWANSYNDCLVWLQSHVPYSWDHAMKHEGWVIIEKGKEHAED